MKNNITLICLDPYLHCRVVFVGMTLLHRMLLQWLLCFWRMPGTWLPNYCGSLLFIFCNNLQGGVEEIRSLCSDFNKYVNTSHAFAPSNSVAGLHCRGLRFYGGSHVLHTIERTWKPWNSYIRNINSRATTNNSNRINISRVCSHSCSMMGDVSE